MHACDNVRKKFELTYVIGYNNSCSHLLKFPTWKLVLRGLTVNICSLTESLMRENGVFSHNSALHYLKAKHGVYIFDLAGGHLSF